MNIYLHSTDIVNVGKEYPYRVHVSCFGESRENVLATVFACTASQDGITRIEIRKKDHHLALLLFKYPGDTIPKEWKDAEIIFEQGTLLLQEEETCIS